MNVSTVLSPIIAKIAGGSRLVDRFEHFVLDATGSVDISRTSGNLSFMWSCWDAVVSRTCDGVHGTPLLPRNQTGPIWNLSAAALMPGGRYEFRVDAVKEERVGSMTVQIDVSSRYSNPTLVQLGLVEDRARMNPTERFSLAGLVTGNDRPDSIVWEIIPEGPTPHYSRLEADMKGLQLSLATAQDHEVLLQAIWRFQQAEAAAIRLRVELPESIANLVPTRAVLMQEQDDAVVAVRTGVNMLASIEALQAAEAAMQFAEDLVQLLTVHLASAEVELVNARYALDVLHPPPAGNVTARMLPGDPENVTEHALDAALTVQYATVEGLQKSMTQLRKDIAAVGYYEMQMLRGGPGLGWVDFEELLPVNYSHVVNHSSAGVCFCANGSGASFENSEISSFALQNLVMTPGAFQLKGGVYTFRLTAQSVSRSYNRFSETAIPFAELTVIVNGAPLHGSLAVSPSSGMTLVDSFKFVSTGWVDDPYDEPLLARFSYCEPDKDELYYFSEYSPFWETIVRILPPGLAELNYTHTIVVEITDLWGAVSTASSTCQVFPYDVGGGDIFTAMRAQVNKLQQMREVGDYEGIWQIIGTVLLILNQQPEYIDPRTLIHPSRQQGQDGSTFTGSRRLLASTADYIALREDLTRGLRFPLADLPLTTAIALRAAQTLEVISKLPSQMSGTLMNELLAIAFDLRECPSIITCGSFEWEKPLLQTMDQLMQAVTYLAYYSDYYRDPATGTAPLRRWTNDVLQLINHIVLSTMHTLVIGETYPVFMGTFAVEIQKQYMSYYPAASAGESVTEHPESWLVRDRGNGSQPANSSLVLLPWDLDMQAEMDQIVYMKLFVWKSYAPWIERADRPGCTAELTDSRYLDELEQVVLYNETKWTRKGVYRYCPGAPILASATLQLVFVAEDGSEIEMNEMRNDSGTYSGLNFTAHDFSGDGNEEELIVMVDGLNQTITLTADIQTLEDAVDALNDDLDGAVASENGSFLLITSVTTGISSTVAIIPPFEVNGTNGTNESNGTNATMNGSGANATALFFGSIYWVNSTEPETLGNITELFNGSTTGPGTGLAGYFSESIVFVLPDPSFEEHIFSNDSNATVNCTYYNSPANRWILDGETDRRSSGYQCEARELVLTAAMLGASPTRTELVLREPRKGTYPPQIFGSVFGGVLLVIAGFFAGFQLVKIDEDLRKEGPKRSARAATNSAYGKAMVMYKHRDQTFFGRAKLSWRTRWTCGGLFCGFRGDPFHRLQKLLIILVVFGLAFALCSFTFVVPIPVLCEELCDCVMDRLVGRVWDATPVCDFDCVETCMRYDCAADEDDRRCTEDFTHASCEGELRCGGSGWEGAPSWPNPMRAGEPGFPPTIGYEPSLRFGRPIGEAAGWLILAGLVCDLLFWWLNKPHREAIFGTADSKLKKCWKERESCRRGTAVGPEDGEQKDGDEVEKKPEEEEEDKPPVDEVAAAMRRKLNLELHLTRPVAPLPDHSPTNPSYCDVPGVILRRIGEKEPRSYHLTIAVKDFKKMPFEVQRQRMVKEALEEELQGPPPVTLKVQTKTPAEWRAERQAEKDAEKRALRKKTTNRMRFMAKLNAQPTYYTVRNLGPSAVPYAIMLAAAAAGAGVSGYVTLTGQFDREATVLWLGAACCALAIKFLAFEVFAVAMAGPVWYDVKWKAPVLWKACKRKCCPPPPKVVVYKDDGDPESTESSEDEDDALVMRERAWELYGGKPDDKPPKVEIDLDEARAWAALAAADIAEAEALDVSNVFKKRAVKAAPTPHQIDRQRFGVSITGAAGVARFAAIHRRDRSNAEFQVTFTRSCRLDRVLRGCCVRSSHSPLPPAYSCIIFAAAGREDPGGARPHGQDAAADRGPQPAGAAGCDGRCVGPAAEGHPAGQAAGG